VRENRYAAGPAYLIADTYRALNSATVIAFNDQCDAIVAAVGSHTIIRWQSTSQGRELSTLASLRALWARPPEQAWARRAVGEGVKFCP